MATLSVQITMAGGYLSTRQDWFQISHSDSRFRSRLDWMRAHYGMTWVELRQILNDIMEDPQWDPLLKEDLQNKIKPFVPVRSGYLLDFIMTTIRYTHLQFMHSHHWLLCNWDLPPNRPKIFNTQTVAHLPPAKGVGPWATIKLNHPIPNVSVNTVLPSGHAIYNLTDPMAEKDYNRKITELAEAQCQDHLDTIFNSILITVMI